MKMHFSPVVCIVLIACLFTGCHAASDKNHINSDSIRIVEGMKLFTQHCNGCHNFRQKDIGPQLNGITTNLSYEWIENFIHNPQHVIQLKDKHADSLYAEYKTIMPAFAYLSNDDISNIIAFLHTHNEQKIIDTSRGLADPIPAKIQLSNLIVKLQLITQIPASSDSNKKPLARITKLDYQPNTNKIFIVDLRGKLYQLQNGKTTVYMDMAKLKPSFISAPGLATGFGSFAFHPQFAKNGLFYTTHAEKAGSAKADFNYAYTIPVAMQWVLTEWKADDPTATVFKGTSRELLRLNMIDAIHGMQEISFNPYAKNGDEDYGLLYVCIGEGGSAENGYPFLIHNKAQILGTVLRIDPLGNNSANGKYGIPSTNPFANNKNELGEIYAYGFRNPHRITWSKAGDMFVCHIGHGNVESIDLVKKGNDYGWPIREGTFVVNPYGDLNKVHPLPANDSSYHITYPIAEFDHDEGKAICGGYEYTGNTVPQLKGKFLFGDIPTGRLFYIDMKDIQQGKEAPIKEWRVSINNTIKKFADMFKNDRVDLRLGKDAQGEIYLLTKADGKVYKIIGTQ